MGNTSSTANHRRLNHRSHMTNAVKIAATFERNPNTSHKDVIAAPSARVSFIETSAEYPLKRSPPLSVWSILRRCLVSDPRDPHRATPDGSRRESRTPAITPWRRAALSGPICRVGCSGFVLKRIRWDPPDPKTVARPYPDGVVIVEAGIDQKGQVVSACVLRGVRSDFDKAAQVAVLKWKFDPLMLQGQSVSAFLTVTVCTPDRKCER